MPYQHLCLTSRYIGSSTETDMFSVNFSMHSLHMRCTLLSRRAGRLLNFMFSLHALYSRIIHITTHSRKNRIPTFFITNVNHTFTSLDYRSIAHCITSHAACILGRWIYLSSSLVSAVFLQFSDIVHSCFHYLLYNIPVLRSMWENPNTRSPTAIVIFGRFGGSWKMASMNRQLDGFSSANHRALRK